MNGPIDIHMRFYDALEIQGPANLKLVKAKSLKIDGPLQFHNLSVAGDAVVLGTFKGDKGKFGGLKVTGSFDADHVICENLTVVGPVTVSSLMVRNKAEIEGSLDAKHCEFKNLSVKGETISLDEVLIENLTVSGNKKLILKGASVISGDIVFESEKGILDIQSPEVHIGGQIKEKAHEKSN